MKSAVCLLVPLGAVPTYLAVSRRNDTQLWGLPGGKVDPGESNLQAVLRETLEEIGLAIPAEEVEPLYCDVCPGKGPDDTYWVTTYVWHRKAGPLTEPFSPETGIAVAWKSEAVLTDPRQSPFAGYNVGVFEAYRKLTAR